MKAVTVAVLLLAFVVVACAGPINVPDDDFNKMKFKSKARRQRAKAKAQKQNGLSKQTSLTFPKANGGQVYSLPIPLENVVCMQAGNVGHRYLAGIGSDIQFDFKGCIQNGKKSTCTWLCKCDPSDSVVMSCNLSAKKRVKKGKNNAAGKWNFVTSSVVATGRCCDVI